MSTDWAALVAACALVAERGPQRQCRSKNILLANSMAYENGIMLPADIHQDGIE
jgi:hypothetical protein